MTSADSPEVRGMTHEVDSSSRARDHMANERTHLAWLRTSANVMVVGLAMARFADKGSVTIASVAAGGLLILIGAVGVLYGTARYRSVNHQLDSGEFVTGGRAFGPTVGAFVLLVGLVASMTILLVAAR